MHKGVSANLMFISAGHPTDHDHDLPCRSSVLSILGQGRKPSFLAVDLISTRNTYLEDA